MDIDALVMTVAARCQVYATGSETWAGPSGVTITEIEFADEASASSAADFLWAGGLAASAVRASVMVLHDDPDSLAVLRRLGVARVALRPAVVAAIAGGHSEAKVAAIAGVDRMTVRSWLGKR